ncbi:hypothetical protein BDY19DRAFT_995286 [Irpex rosettiformis]|uniref:Uncharacterized protein n=1 Tax=Irpex rosettiformis TaxID=378272 RepID=A0ACB8TZG3_9APHY|nr:hypothetical protein BDY19DRAFT_995286 [Irpex rosettiformis]
MRLFAAISAMIVFAVTIAAASPSFLRESKKDRSGSVLKTLKDDQGLIRQTPRPEGMTSSLVFTGVDASVLTC